MQFHIVHIDVDNDRRPLSLTENRKPVFTWAVWHRGKGERQSAYSISVTCGERVLWSAEAETSEQRAVYGGEPLVSGEIYRVSLRVRDSKGEECAEKSVCFRYLGKRLWSAIWINTAEECGARAKYFYRGFNLAALPTRATLYASGIGYQYVTVNGEDVERSFLNPAVSNFNKLCYYTVTDVTSALRLGKNSLCAIVGEGWRETTGFFTRNEAKPDRLFGETQFIAELELTFADGRTEIIPTDESWFAGFGAIVKNGLFIGETYDASAEPKGWASAEYDGAGLGSAVPALGVVGELCPQTHPPVVEQERFSAKVIRYLPDDNSFIYDFGKNIAGVCELNVPEGLPVGTEISLEFTEEILPNGDLDRETLRDAKVTKDVYIVGENGPTRWLPRFTYHGFRYAKISGMPVIPDESTLVAVAFCNGIKNRSFFRCGDPLVEKLQENVVRTEMNNLHHIATDCPQRDERMGWMNDATVRFEEMPYNFHMGRMFRKILRDVVLDMDPVSGSITDTAPFVWGSHPADPVCSSFLIAGLELLLHYGDKDTLCEYYEPFKRWNECLASLINGEGIITYSSYGDWAGPADFCDRFVEGSHSMVTPGALMSTGYHYYNCRLLAEFADALGKHGEAETHRARAEAVRQSFLKKWFIKREGVVANASQGSQAFALWLGILPQEDEKRAARVMAEAVRRVGHRLTTGNLTYRYLLDMLVKYGYTDDAWKLVSREDYPSWGYMIRNGATTVWERFEFKRGSGMNSHDHPMYGAVGAWFYTHLLGVTPREYGWRSFNVKPCFPSELLWAEGRIDTPMGDIYLRWQRQLGSIDVLAVIPFGTAATLVLPDGERVLSSGSYSFSIEAVD